MRANLCIEIQTSEAPRPAVPPWFAEVTIIVQYLTTKGLLDAFAHQVRLIRGRFGRYEPIDFLALLLGYAIVKDGVYSSRFRRVLTQWLGKFSTLEKRHQSRYASH